MHEMTNRDRAERGLRAMVAWAGRDYSAEVLQASDIEDIGDVGQEALGDMLGDLRHVAHIAGIDFDAARYSSHCHFAEELAEEE